MKAVLATILCLLVACITHAVGDSVCPPEDETSPCTCNADQMHDIRCSGLLHTSDLINAFKRFAGRSFEDLTIASSVLQYIPREIFEEVRFKRIYVMDSTFIDLFDGPPTSLTTLERIHIEKSTFYRTIWKNLTPLTNLNELSISKTQVRVLDENFGKSLPKSLKIITLRETNTRTIKPGAFHGLDNIEILEVKDAELTSLRRDMFPTPFNADSLTFNQNKLTTLPKGLFSQMPKLKVVDLRVNQLSEIPEDAFGETGSQLDILLLDVNPLKCDCGLEWLLKNRLNVRSGICVSPDEMKGKSLSALTTADLDC